MNGKPRIRVSHLILVFLLASLCFGGSFTCSGHSGDDDWHETRK